MFLYTAIALLLALQAITGYAWYRTARRARAAQAGLRYWRLRHADHLAAHRGPASHP